MESIGNDFVLIQEENCIGYDIREIAKAICNRRFGIGSDGLLVVSGESRPTVLKMFNPDGTEDFCGNGLRCAGLHAFREGWVPKEFEQCHGNLRVPTKVDEDGSVTIQLPPASFDPSDIPTVTNGEFVDRPLHGLIGSAISTGSAHFVTFVDTLPQDAKFFETGSRIENDPMFPEKISVMFTKILSPKHLQLRIWERGAGETLGCGTGSVAAAVVWARQTNQGGEFIVSNPGGDVRVDMDNWTSSVSSTTKPSHTYHGKFNLLALMSEVASKTSSWLLM